MSMPVKSDADIAGKDCRNRLNLRNTQGDAMLQNNTDEKAEIYDTLSSMNRAFVGIVQSLQTLQKKGLFQSKAAKLFPSFAQELRRPCALDAKVLR